MCLPRLPLACLIACAVLAPRAHAADLIAAGPLTERILLLHVDDGTVVRHGPGQPTGSDFVLTPFTPLSPGAADSTATFTITSADDPNYATARQPTQVGRKSKATEFTMTCDAWDNATQSCVAVNPDHTKEHGLYLTLPHALVPGRTYTVAWTGSLAVAPASATFTFHPDTSRSEAVHVNLLGYSPSAPGRYGYLYHWMGTRGSLDLAAWAGRPFRLVEAAGGATVFTGTIAFRKSATNAETGQASDTPGRNFLGAAVWECDFSAFSTPGTYRLAVDGIGCSFPFEIRTDAYRTAFRAVMKGIFQQRSGIALDAAHTNQPRPAPHNPLPVAQGGTPGFQNRLFYTTARFCDHKTDGGGAADKAALEAGRMGNLTATWGWYQDAGDWDGYVTHLDVPIGLLLLYATDPAKFTDGELTIPESGNGVPDLVDEAAWLPRFYRRLRAELVAKGWGTGGVGGRQFGDYWGDNLPDGVGAGSWQDTARAWYVTGEDPFTSFRYAAAAAQLAHVFATLGVADPEGVDWTQEAQETYAWALANTRSGDEGKSVDGQALRFHRALAAVALYRATGASATHTQFVADMADVTATTEIEGAQLFATTLYLTLPAGRATDAAVRTRLLGALRHTAQQRTFNGSAPASARATRFAGNWWMPMLNGQGSHPLINPVVYAVGPLAAAGETTLSNQLRGAVFTTADYFLGTNPLNLVYITGVGPRHVTDVLNLDSRYSAAGNLRVGIVPYGPKRNDDGVGNGWWDHEFPRRTTTPAYDSWPGHERWFNQGPSPATGEYTVWQTLLPAAIAYGSLTELDPGPVVDTPPASLSVIAGDPAALTVTASAASGVVTCAWERLVSGDTWEPVAGAASATLAWPSAQSFHAGTYRAVLQANGITVRSAAATLTVTDPPASPARILNLSTRALCLTGDDRLLPGFVIRGTGTKRLLVRGIGPALDAWGVPGFLANPRLVLQRRVEGSTWEVVDEADDWSGHPSAPLAGATAASTGAFALTPGSRDAALVVDLPEGVYTVVNEGVGDGTGVALVEVYDADAPEPAARLVNMANRGFVGGGADVMISGFVVSGEGSKTVLLRAVGPRLAAFGLGGTLADPLLQVFRQEGGAAFVEILANNDWETGADAARTALVASTIGAFPLEAGGKDAAFVVALPPGVYSVIASGADGGTGTVLLEVYVVD